MHTLLSETGSDAIVDVTQMQQSLFIDSYSAFLSNTILISPILCTDSENSADFAVCFSFVYSTGISLENSSKMEKRL